jgi:prophage maintenance system killer protein
MRGLNASEIMAINSVVTAPYGETCYVADQAAVDEAAQAQQSANSAEAAAGALLEILLLRSPFAAGNTRTGLVATLWLLDQEGRSLQGSDEELASQLRRIKNERWDRSRITEWVAGATRRTTTAS